MVHMYLSLLNTAVSPAENRLFCLFHFILCLFHLLKCAYYASLTNVHSKLHRRLRLSVLVIDPFWDFNCHLLKIKWPVFFKNGSVVCAFYADSMFFDWQM